jgi:hypothetical protein
VGKQVFLGLETVDLPDETDFAFSSQGSGGSRVVVERIDDERARISWITEDAWEQLGGQLGGQLNDPDGTTVGTVTLRESRATPVPSNKLSFAGYGRNELEVVIEQTRLELQHFPSFYGFAIHSYESYRPWLEGSR